ncbi:MAG: hypothetical protein A3F10_05590 [Coxiella sp. RIFCSPHIGHO2_12_FULL_42_15]|nr:MAG: hypothetical protein A3F10_05590 [Coxiella sp. RIFCSPHIGHO2_12_FULL_42_15]
MENPKISIVIPTAECEGKKFLPRCLNSIKSQNYTNYEIILVEEGKVAHNMNCGIKKATGDIIKILCHDDYLNGSFSLEEIVVAWKGGWLVSACVHDQGDGNLILTHYPGWNDHIHRGFNTIGGLSVLAFENKDPLLFTEGLDWVVDVDFYKRAFQRYGLPRFLVTPNVVIGYGSHQATFKLTQEQRTKEMDLMLQTYGE